MLISINSQLGLVTPLFSSTYQLIIIHHLHFYSFRETMYVYKYLYKHIDFSYLYNVYLCKALTFERYFNAKIIYLYIYS